MGSVQFLGSSTPDPICDFLYLVTDTEDFRKSAIDKFVDISKNKPTLEKLMLSGIENRLELGDNFERRIQTIASKGINETIEYYIKYEELIDEGVLIPFIDTKVNYADFIDIFPIIRDSLFKVSSQNYYDNLDSERRMFDTDKDLFLSWVDSQGKEMLDIYRFLMTSLSLKQLFPANQTENLSVGGDENKAYIDEISKLMASFLKQYPESQSSLNVAWPTPEDEIIFPILSNIPHKELVQIREKEKDALEKYKYSVQEKLADIRSAVGTDDY